ncbi:hypothetical protein O0L34_g19358 [Tuta absoluta]|nr:hypothetical protein O0L34_g19358 [Tuta absoluta]
MAFPDLRIFPAAACPELPVSSFGGQWGQFPVRARLIEGRTYYLVQEYMDAHAFWFPWRAILKLTASVSPGGQACAVLVEDDTSQRSLYATLHGLRVLRSKELSLRGQLPPAIVAQFPGSNVCVVPPTRRDTSWP